MERKVFRRDDPAQQSGLGAILPRGEGWHYIGDALFPDETHAPENCHLGCGMWPKWLTPVPGAQGAGWPCVVIPRETDISLFYDRWQKMQDQSRPRVSGFAEWLIGEVGGRMATEAEVKDLIKA